MHCCNIIILTFFKAYAILHFMIDQRTSKPNLPERIGNIVTKEEKRNTLSSAELRRKGVGSMLAGVALLGAGIGLGESVQAAAPQAAFEHCETYTVHPGDTAWDIAKDVYGDKRNETDIRPLVHEIEAANPGSLQAWETFQLCENAEGEWHIPKN